MIHVRQCVKGIKWDNAWYSRWEVGGNDDGDEDGRGGDDGDEDGGDNDDNGGGDCDPDDDNFGHNKRCPLWDAESQQCAFERERAEWIGQESSGGGCFWLFLLYFGLCS